MALIVLVSDKGAPGVTTTSLAMAAVWPRRSLLAECDPQGGDLVYRLPAEHGGPLDPNRGLVSLAVSARRGLEPGQLIEHSQRIQGGLDVLVGLGNAEQTAGMAGLWGNLGRALDRYADYPHGADVIADCGRVGPDSPTLDLMPQAALVLVVGRSDAEQVAHLRDRVNGLSHRLHAAQGSSISMARPPIGVLLIAEPKGAKRTAAQVAELLSHTAAGAEVLGVIADDPEGAAAINGRARSRVDKSLLIRSVRETVGNITRRYGLLHAGGLV